MQRYRQQRGERRERRQSLHWHHVSKTDHALTYSNEVYVPERGEQGPGDSLRKKCDQMYTCGGF